MASTGKRRRKKPIPKRGSKRVPPKARKKPAPKKRSAKRAKKVPVPTRTRTPKKKIAKRAPKKKGVAKKKSRSAIAKKGWVTRRIVESIEREREEREEREGRDPGSWDAEVIDDSGDDVADDYTPYPTPDLIAPEELDYAIVDRHSYATAMEWLEDRFGISEDHAAADADEIEWFPTFDEVYDYIDALVEEYDLDAHDMFELAFGYKGDDAA